MRSNDKPPVGVGTVNLEALLTSSPCPLSRGTAHEDQIILHKSVGFTYGKIHIPPHLLSNLAGLEIPQADLRVCFKGSAATKFTPEANFPNQNENSLVS